MSRRPEILERLRRLLGMGGDGRPAPTPPRPPSGDALPPGCEDVAEIPCEEAARRVYEYLDGEMADAEAERIRCHVQQCERCYPMYDWERLFLDALKERGDRSEASEELRRRVAGLLDGEAG